MIFGSFTGGISVMKIIVMSDSHGSYAAVQSIMDRTADADMFIFLGDGEREVEKMKADYPDRDIRYVCGNCDHASFAPPSLVIETPYGDIIAVHGHRHGVKSGVDFLGDIASDNDCTVALFGHTHMRHESYENGIYFMNPGSCALPRDGLAPSFGVLNMSEAGILTNVADV